MALLAAALLCAAMVTSPATAVDSGPPDFTPSLVLGYVDPASGDRFECGAGCRRMEIPDGVELEVAVQVLNRGGSSGGGGAAWHLWFDEPLHPFPGLDLEVCFDADGGLDHGCWQAMRERVDHELWAAKVADLVCVPETPGTCREQVVRLRADADHDGQRRQGTYHVAVWVNRFGEITERDEFDNWAGPVRVTVVPGPGPDVPARQGPAADSPLVVPTEPRPYTVIRVPEVAERGFSLASDRARAVLDFVPDAAGEVLVEIDQGGGQDVMIAAVRKLSSGEVLVEGRGRRRLELAGRIGPEHLKDDRRFAVEVTGGPGTRGVRGVIRVEYPARTLYRVAE